MVDFEHEEAATELIQEDSHPMVNIAIQVKRPEAVLPQQKVEVSFVGRTLQMTCPSSSTTYSVYIC